MFARFQVAASRRGALHALLASPVGEELLLFDLPLNLRLLQRALAFEIQLPLHRHVLGGLVLLELAFLRLPVDRQVAGHAANGAPDEHRRRAVAEDGAAGTGTERGTAHGSDTRTAGFASGNTQGERSGEENVAAGKAWPNRVLVSWLFPHLGGNRADHLVEGKRIVFILIRSLERFHFVSHYLGKG